MDEQYHARVRDLQGNLRREHDMLAGLASGTDEYDAQVGRVLTASDELLAYEDQIPTLIDEERRRISSRIVVGVYTAAAVVSVVLGLVSGFAVVTRWWLVAIVPTFFCAANLALTESGLPREGYRARRISAYLAAPAVLLLALTVLGLPVWLLGGVVVLGVAAAGAWIHGTLGVHATSNATAGRNP